MAGVQPGSGPESGGGVVSLQGAHLGESGLLCRFGSAAPGAAQFVSTAVARCEAAAHAEGAVALEVSLGDGGQQYSRSGAVYEYVAEAEVGGVEPAEGPEAGGTVVTLVGRELGQAEGAACRFGSAPPEASG